MTERGVLKALAYLYRIVEAGERGYAVCAANVSNQGLKLLFRSYTQQRARFKSEILAEIQRMGGQTRPRSSARGMIHRGRIDIFAALTIGNEARERVVLKEIMIGERVALGAYERVLSKQLPAETQAMVLRQCEGVSQVIEQVQLIWGRAGKRMLVRLFDTAEEAEQAIDELQNAGFHPGAVEIVPLASNIEVYQGRGTTRLETAVSGAAGGALWGGAIGVLAGVGAEQAANLAPFGGSPASNAWLVIALAGILGGALVGGLLGTVIGIGIFEEDAYAYDESMKHGQLIVLVLVDVARASEAGRVMGRSVRPIIEVS